MEESQEKSLHPPQAAHAEICRQSATFAISTQKFSWPFNVRRIKRPRRWSFLTCGRSPALPSFSSSPAVRINVRYRRSADEIEEQLKKQLSTRPVRIEGYSTAEWVLLDYGDFIVHIFNSEAREFYDLERLWRMTPDRCRVAPDNLHEIQIRLGRQDP